ncbi:MAG: hypothetical protein EZS28_021835 [Streblomastix strix]|uniref:B30.2/SPRY domain-containing protein n=1 Tax=Streblomastix strix TaxID=222440 RepID=A0A5J4VJ90_9EUKA|nr:MAG: hypothetical protein EZS28_021835 [Streblomastix strix]
MKNPDPDTVILKYVDGIHRKVVLNKTVERAIGINPVITNGIYLFEIIYKNIYNHQGTGIVKASYSIPKQCNPHYKFSLNDNMNIICFDAYAGQIWYKGQETSGNSKYKDGQKIGLQLDMEKGTLHFFIDDIQQPVFVRGINEPVRFFGHIYDGGASFTIVSFRKLYDAAIYTLPNEKVIDW